MAHLDFVRPMPAYYGKTPCCGPDPSCLPTPIPKWPTVAEYQQATKVATANFARLSHKLGKNYMLGVVKNNELLANAKRAWLWFYALYNFNPLLFEGNILTAEQYWKIVERVYDMQKSCASDPAWSSWG